MGGEGVLVETVGAVGTGLAHQKKKLTASRLRLTGGNFARSFTIVRSFRDDGRQDFSFANFVVV